MKPEAVEERLRAAAITLQCLDSLDAEGDDLVEALNIADWPEIIAASWDGYRSVIVAQRLRPTLQEVVDMQEVFVWLGWLDALTQEIVWRRALGQRWRDVSQRAHCVRHTCWRRWKAGVVFISQRLRQAGRQEPQSATATPAATPRRSPAKAQGGAS